VSGSKRTTPSGGAGKLNRLEQAIIAAEDGAEDARWAQAEEVVRLIGEGQSQGDIAADWINLRTGKPYSQSHVKLCAKVWREYERTQIRNWFVDAYEAAKGSTTRVEHNEAQPPASEETAERLVQNLLDKAPDTVVDTVYHGLKLARQGKYTPPAERKAREAKGRVTLKPLRQAVAAFTAMGVVGSIQDATEELREMIGDEALTEENFRQIEEVNAEWQQELVVARAMLGMDDEEIR